MNPKKIILTRTVPMDKFKKILKHVKTLYPKDELVLLLQKGVANSGEVPGNHRFLEVPDGMLKYHGLTPGFIKRLREEKFDIFIITAKVLYAPGYEELITLARSTDAADIFLISSYLGLRTLRSGGVDIKLDEKEIVKLSSLDVKTRFAYAKYYDNVENSINHQWQTMIYPLIKNHDFSRVLELAPGHGRNTNKLKDLADEILLVDANKSCIDICKERFKNYNGPCRLSYYVNDGQSLAQIEDDSVSFIYSWDSMVHFDKLLMLEYIKEFYRVLRPGGFGFVHHSNFGTLSPQANFSIGVNPHGRSNMSKVRFMEYCHDVGLTVVRQEIIDWGIKELDCLSLFKK